MDIAEFLRARLAEDEQAAQDALQAAQGANWEPLPSWGGVTVSGPAGMAVAHGPLDELHPDIADHIARHDPARILAEVAAKRAIIDQFTVIELPEQSDGNVAAVGAYVKMVVVLGLLALPYRDHPDFDPQWPASG